MLSGCGLTSCRLEIQKRGPPPGSPLRVCAGEKNAALERSSRQMLILVGRVLYLNLVDLLERSKG